MKSSTFKKSSRNLSQKGSMTRTLACSFEMLIIASLLVSLLNDMGFLTPLPMVNALQQAQPSLEHRPSSRDVASRVRS